MRGAGRSGEGKAHSPRRSVVWGMRVLDLFSGTKSWSQPWQQRGHDVRTLDNDSRFKPTYTADILGWDVEELGTWKPDVILASPPCESFSVLNIGKNWGTIGQGSPALSDAAVMGMALVDTTLDVIAALQPRYFIIENPRAKLRRLWLLKHLERRTIWYCHYGDTRAKPTDLWGGFPEEFRPRPECHNTQPQHPQDCCCRDHTSAPRGSKNPGSVKGWKRGSPERGEIPRLLSLHVCLAAERSF